MLARETVLGDPQESRKVTDDFVRRFELEPEDFRSLGSRLTTRPPGMPR